MTERKKLVEMLIAEGIITRGQLERALAEQKLHGGRLGVIMRNLGYVTEESIIKVLGEQLHISLENFEIIEPDILKMIPGAVARHYQAIPLYKEGNVITVAMVDPLDVFAIDDISRITGSDIYIVVSSESDILKAIDRFYPVASSKQEAMKNFSAQAILKNVVEKNDAALVTYENLESKIKFLERKEYRFIFDRDIFCNLKALKCFSIEYIVSNNLETIKAKMSEQASQPSHIDFYFNEKPSEPLLCMLEEELKGSKDEAFMKLYAENKKDNADVIEDKRNKFFEAKNE